LFYPSPTIDRATAVRLPVPTGGPLPSEPVSLWEIKEELRITLDDELARLDTLASAARQWIEQQYRLALIAGQHRCTVPVTANGRADLPIYPVREVLSVARRGRDGVDEALTETQWRADLDYRPARVWLPCAGVYVVTCATGWESPALVPGPVKQAVIYRVWGYFDRVPTEDWMRIVRHALQPYTLRAL
jgi:uncharacterized phiE125 gp8 family phage protein